MADGQQTFDIAPFALPNCAPGEVRFEDPRDIHEVRVTFRGEAPGGVGVSYLRRYWPGFRRDASEWDPYNKPFRWGWYLLDDQFTCDWQKAAVDVVREGTGATVTFRPLSEELPEGAAYPVTYRHTLGFRIDCPDPSAIERIEVFTASPTVTTRLRVLLDAGRHTAADAITLSAYNAAIAEVLAGPGTQAAANRLALGDESERWFDLVVTHMHAQHPVDGDAGLVTFALSGDAFTISLQSLEEDGPIWHEGQGIYIAATEEGESFAEYRRRHEGRRTVKEMVLSEREQSFPNARFSQPRPRIENTGFILGYKYARQTFRMGANGDILLDYFNVEDKGPGRDTPRFKNASVPPDRRTGGMKSARFLFGLERWYGVSSHCDPAPVMAFNVHVRKDALVLEQKSYALPLQHDVLDNDMQSDAPMVAMVRFHYRNAGQLPRSAELRLRYTQSIERSHGALEGWVLDPRSRQSDYLIGKHEPEPLRVCGDQVRGSWMGEDVLRCIYQADVQAIEEDGAVVLSKELAPGEEWVAVLKIPFIALDTDEELAALARLDFGRGYRDIQKYWHGTAMRGARIRTPVPEINELWDFSLSHQEVSDCLRPDGSGLINVPTGASTYKDFPKESVLMTHHLDERGLHEEALKRLGVWLKYQGTMPLPGMFTDQEGLFWGSGGFEGRGYNQHHGWILWGLSEHLSLTGDQAWFAGIAPQILAGVDWITRQRHNTMKPLPHSRGWEYGFLPAGALEDIEEYSYWLSTNVITWWGMNRAAQALAEIGHPQSERVQREADSYKADFIRGIETIRRQAPLVPLRDGRWVPDYPSRIYRRGRDVGWTREVYEGSMWLLITGLYDPKGEQAEWIINDYHDNRYIKPPYGYLIPDLETYWYARGGACEEPNYFPDSLPYLDRDEPEVYMWMFFNAWCFCWQQELCAMAEHPAPFPGFHNMAVFKNSEELGALTWLQYMYVHAKDGTLYLGRALPREWLADGSEIEATEVATVFGEVGVRFRSAAAHGQIAADVSLHLRRQPERIVLRVRHPDKAAIVAVSVNGRPHTAFDAVMGDIDLTGCDGELQVVARYA
ncbi:MAG: hypothetical protein ACYC5O_01485 [Anaerolineae bacterium]